MMFLLCRMSWECQGFDMETPLGLPNAVVGFLGLAGRICRGAVPVFVVDTEAKGGSGQG